MVLTAMAFRVMRQGSRRDIKNIPDVVLGGYQAYDDFAFTSAATITGMNWWGFVYPYNVPTISDSYNYIIAKNPGSNGQPGAVVASGSLSNVIITDTGSVVRSSVTGFRGHVSYFSDEVYTFDAAVAPGITLLPGKYSSPFTTQVPTTGQPPTPSPGVPARQPAICGLTTPTPPRGAVLKPPNWRST